MSWLLLILGAAAGGFVNGLAGFGTALFALGFWLQIMEPPEAVALVAIVSVATGLQGVWTVRAAIPAARVRLARFLGPALIGVPLGVAALSALEAGALKLVIGGFMLLYGGFFTLRRTLPTLTRPRPAVDALIGFLGGFLGGAASLSGALPTMWSALQPWTKLETRAVLQPFNVTVLALTAGALAVADVYSVETAWRLAVALPVGLVAAQLGIALFKRLRDAQFRRLLTGLMFVSGAVLIARTLW